VEQLLLLNQQGAKMIEDEDEEEDEDGIGAS
jgi:hypothetical protein